MANAYTDILSGTSLGTNLVKTAYDRLINFQLRSRPFFRQIADKRPAQQSMPGDSITMQFYQDMTAATSTLAETTDPDSVQIPATTTVSVTLAEYGNAALVTRKLRLFALSDVDPAVAEIISFNMLDSIDRVVRTVLIGGTNVTRENAAAMTFSGSTAAVAATDYLKARDVRASVTKMRARNAIPRIGELFVHYLHPDQSYDLRTETGSANWRTPHEYNANGGIWAGAIGEFEGALHIESPRIYYATDGAASARVYRSLMVGRQALAEATAQEFGVVFGPITDKLMRFRPIGWHGVAGWSIFRQDCLQRIETSASILS